ncbi:leucyl aminopeptidase [Geobacter argillaceus]|uniref:Probable cytosol aminopeptidase n=1 Tax=Geobacter argillaceus TaxID=345631 RepID=A0A562VNK2_9BACT|nr:leucyl aminopeptidase [Geobacter argillaceus]TWJ19566.1 leucyl aminopeptidase [Geobacter argillaceus]
MKFSAVVADPTTHPCPALIIGCFEELSAAPLLAELDRALHGAITALYAQKEFTGGLNKTKIVHTCGRLPAERLLLVGLGKAEELTAERLRQGAGSAAQALRGARLTTASSVLHLAGLVPDEAATATTTGTMLGGYAFTRYKTGKDEPKPLAGVTLLLRDKREVQTVKKAMADAEALCRGVLLARDLVSLPGNEATPAYIAGRALELAGLDRVNCVVLERTELEELGMGGLLAVGKGSQHAPRFVVLEYQGGSPGQRPVVLVGKGVTFDSGGISLKPREGMERMKDDMAGAAAVLGTIRAAAELGLPVNVTGLVPLAENMPDGGAYKPGDIVTTLAGKTVEINNTDAEGRMILCDALHYAQRYKPAALIDLATLTGACLVALGDQATGMLGTDEGLTRAIARAGEATGERVWELPLWEEYGEAMKSDVADLKNAGGPHAGTITAAWFLKQFSGKAKWVHLDIAGTAWEEKGRHYLPKGATGVGVRLLIEYLRGVTMKRH